MRLSLRWEQSNARNSLGSDYREIHPSLVAELAPEDVAIEQRLVERLKWQNGYPSRSTVNSSRNDKPRHCRRCEQPGPKGLSWRHCAVKITRHSNGSSWRWHPSDTLLVNHPLLPRPITELSQLQFGGIKISSLLGEWSALMNCLKGTIPTEYWLLTNMEYAYLYENGIANSNQSHMPDATIPFVPIICNLCSDDITYIKLKKTPTMCFVVTPLE
jgi:hypothetical protein